MSKDMTEDARLRAVEEAVKFLLLRHNEQPNVRAGAASGANQLWHDIKRAHDAAQAPRPAVAASGMTEEEIVEKAFEAYRRSPGNHAESLAEAANVLRQLAPAGLDRGYVGRALEALCAEGLFRRDQMQHWLRRNGYPDLAALLDEGGGR